MTLQRAAHWTIVVAATVYLLVAGRSLILPFVLGIAYVQLQNDLSLLPMCVFLGLYRLTQVGLVLYFRANPV